MAIGWPGSVDPMRGLPVRRLLAYGESHVDKVTRSAHATRTAGFILPEEEASIVAEATSAPIPK